MFRPFVPRKLQPWVYVFIAFTFQMSGGMYMGALNQMIGGQALMREDILMCMYANLAGMAIYFPLLFRMKFRFTNKTLLTSSALGVLVCNLIAPHITFLPLLWAVCFVSGMCKIQGTFECMSNIQLWMTPKRDFTVFFPVLHIIILCSIQFSDLMSVYLLHHFHWTYMHLFIASLMLIDLLILRLCIRHFRFMRKFPLFGIDWSGMALWAALLLQVTFFFNYGDFYDWLASPVMRQLGVGILFTAGFAVWRMMSIRHPFFEPKMWTYKHLLPVFLMITLVEAILATEHVLEEVFYEEVMRYEETVTMQLNGVAIAGILLGCGFAYWWMHIRRYNYLRLILIGFVGLTGYLTSFYLTMDSGIHISQLALPVLCRSFAYAVLSIAFITALEEIMSFQHFFQSLSVFNMLHMVVGGVLGAAVYARGLSYYIPDNLARYGAHLDRVAFSRSPFPLGEYMEGFVSRMTEVSLKQLYGWVAYACILVFLLLLLYDAPVRRKLKEMPRWKEVGRQVRNSFWRVRNKA